MPEPTTVWLVRAGSVDDVEGRIALEEGAVTFTPRDADAPSLRVSLADVTEARRLRGSPVLRLRRRRGGTLLVYFTKPPAIGPSGRPVGRSMMSPFRSVERAAAGMQLRAAGTANRATVDAWVRAITERA